MASMCGAVQPWWRLCSEATSTSSMVCVLKPTFVLFCSVLFCPCSLVYKAVQAPEYQGFLQQALKAAAGKSKDPSRPYAAVADVLSVIIGCEMLKIVPGRVSTEVGYHWGSLGGGVQTGSYLCWQLRRNLSSSRCECYSVFSVIVCK